MFIKAIEKIQGFTKPIHTITRTYGGIVTQGASTLFFVNDNGVAITCKHVAQMILGSQPLTDQYNSFKAEKAQLEQGKRYRAQLQGLEARYNLKKEHTSHIKSMFLDCGDFQGITIHTHSTLDLAILVLEGFTNKAYSSHATFINDPAKIKPGKFLCRYGYPFPEYTNFTYSDVNEDLEWTQAGVQNAVPFPIEGMITRMIGSPDGIIGIEMSTPGLRGQSGGPLFDEEGHVYGMQAATGHLHLGFDIKDMDIIADGKKQRVSNSPFLHVGQCIHVDKIKEFLTEKGVQFHTS